MDLSCAALDVLSLLARLKVLPPASVRHLAVQQEPTRFLHLHTRAAAWQQAQQGNMSVRTSWEWKVIAGQVGSIQEVLSHVTVETLDQD